MDRITEDTTLEDILRHPGTSSILVKHGIYCPTCPFARFEMSKLRIGDVARTYRVNIDNLLKELNETLRKGQT